ncbi:hypothetical protein GQ43DRAFT_344552, partial [Delitschia confertaspora ATCC 74209]
DDDYHEEPSEDEPEHHDSELEEEPSRPNRFLGTSQKWKRYTEGERQVAASLEQIESGDLAAHLYNAHALKARVRIPHERLAMIKNWQSKDLWLRKGEELNFTDPFGVVQRELVPFRSWTAWPLGGGKAPKPDEVFGRKRANVEDEKWTIGGLGEEEVGDELKEELLAVFLRLAKEKWRARESTHEGEEAHDTLNEKGAGSRATSRARSRSVRSQRSTSTATQHIASDVEMRESQDFTTDTTRFSGTESEYNRCSKIQRKGITEPLFSEPAILTDDDKARRILQPSINSILSKLDNLALTIRRTRLNHFGGTCSDTSGSEVAASDVSVSRSRSRSRAGSRIKDASRILSGAENGPSRETKKKHQPRKGDNDSGNEPNLDPEEHVEAEARSDSADRSASKRQRGRARSTKSGRRFGERTDHMGLIDWSEVLGIASMIGWDEGAVARTAQRCASLFNEGMAFRKFEEGDVLKPPSQLIQYTPQAIPSPDATTITSAGIPSSVKRPLFEPGMIHCPHTDCWGHHKEFKIAYRVVEHVKRVHGYDPRTNDSNNMERKYGAVHIDGFMQPINPKRGWHGNGRSKSVVRTVKRKKGKHDGSVKSPSSDS